MAQISITSSEKEILTYFQKIRLRLIESCSNHVLIAFWKLNLQLNSMQSHMKEQLNVKVVDTSFVNNPTQLLGFLTKLLRKIRKIPRLTRVLKSKIALCGAFQRFLKLYQLIYLGKFKTGFLISWRCTTKTRVKWGFFRILRKMFCKSSLNAVAAPWRHGIKPGAALSLVHNQVVRSSSSS